MIPLPVSFLSDVRQIRWDSPFRFVASLLGIASVVVVLKSSVSRPSEALKEAAHWAGIRVDADVAAVVGWMNDPARADFIAWVASVILGLALFKIVCAPSSRGIGVRAAPTAWLAVTLYLEIRGDEFRSSWLSLAVFISVCAIVKARRPGSWAFLLAILELAMALGWAVLTPIIWLLLDGSPAQEQTSTWPATQSSDAEFRSHGESVLPAESSPLPPHPAFEYEPQEPDSGVPVTPLEALGARRGMAAQTPDDPPDKRRAA